MTINVETRILGKLVHTRTLQPNLEPTKEFRDTASRKLLVDKSFVGNHGERKFTKVVDALTPDLVEQNLFVPTLKGFRKNGPFIFEGADINRANLRQTDWGGMKTQTVVWEQSIPEVKIEAASE